MSVATQLEKFPIAAFIVVMGLCGFALSCLQIEAHPVTANLNIKLADFFSWFALVVFILLLILLLVKAIFYRQQFKADFSNYSSSGFFATIPVAMILLSGCFFEINIKFSQYLWMVGSSLQLLITIIIVNRWIYSSDLELKHLTPIWFIPVIGNILVPVTGVQFASLAFSWMFLMIGLLLWLLLFSLIMFKFMFDSPLTKKLQSTMFILIAPPATAFIAITTLQPELDVLPSFLYYSAVFIFLLLIVKLPEFLKLEFKLVSWAYSFPLATLAIASFRFYELENIKFIGIFAWILSGLLSIIMIWLIVNTTLNLVRNGVVIDRPE